ncbi:fibronectin type III domain-containing protein [Cryomorphaceae bacterium 1068]|nr:fibronectin type III domain-containing protein [Cryomorphaceae bacterium 1068]
MAIIKAGVASLSTKSLVLFTRKLINRMTGNTNFPTPTPDLADIQTKLDEFVVLATEAEDGTKRDRVARDTVGKELKEMLRVLANYVAMVAAGDENIILSSGFDVRNEAEPAPPLTIPAALKALRSSHSGVVELDWDPVPNALTYRIMMTTSDPNLVEAEWTTGALTSKSKAEINNLTAGQYYWFKVQAVGRSGMSGYSDPATVMAA